MDSPVTDLGSVSASNPTRRARVIQLNHCFRKSAATSYLIRTGAQRANVMHELEINSFCAKVTSDSF